MTDKAILDAIIEDLKGQCVKGLSQVCEEHGIVEDDLSVEDHSYIDGEVFLCEGCNWWCAAEEMSTKDGVDWTCDECEPEGD